MWYSSFPQRPTSRKRRRRRGRKEEEKMCGGSSGIALLLILVLFQHPLPAAAEDSATTAWNGINTNRWFGFVSVDYALVNFVIYGNRWSGLKMNRVKPLGYLALEVVVQ